MTQTYGARLLDGGSDAGSIDIEAATLAEAWDKAESWAQGGDWDHAGSVTLVVSAGEDERREEISVGA